MVTLCCLGLWWSSWFAVLRGCVLIVVWVSARLVLGGVGGFVLFDFDVFWLVWR